MRGALGFASLTFPDKDYRVSWPDVLENPPNSNGRERETVHVIHTNYK